MPNSPAEEQRINAIRFLAVDAVQKANSGHPGLPMGAAALAYTLWTRHLRFNPRDPHWLNRDRFVLSAGHGSMLLYALLYLTGYDLTLDDIKNFRQLGSKTPGHPEAERTAGSRGHDRAARTRRRQLRRNGHRAGASRRRLQPRRRGDRRSLHVLSLRRRRSHGRDQSRGDLTCGPPQARKADRLLRRQFGLARGTDRRRAFRRPGRALRCQRLAHPVHRRRSRQRRRDDRSRDRRGKERHRPAVVHRRPNAHRLRVAAPRQLSRARRAARPRQRQEVEGAARLAARARLLRSRRRARVLSRHRREGRRVRERVARHVRRLEARQLRSIESARARARVRAAARPPVANLHGREREHRDARRRRHGDERHRRGAPRARRRIGRPRSLDENVSQELRRLRTQRLRWTQRPLRRPRTRDGGGDQRHLVARRAVALRRDVLQLRGLPASRRCASRVSREFVRFTSSRTTRSSSAKTAPRTSRSSSSRCCARHRTAS